MSLAARTDAEVRRRLDRLREVYGPFSVAETTVENDPECFAHGRERAEQGWIGDAGAWVTDDRGRALFIRHPDAPDAWGVPGGSHEPGERLTETARREVHEETGVAVEITGVWRARRTEIVHAEDPDRRLHMLTVWFEATGEGEPAADDEEVLEARWFAEPPDRVGEFLEPKVAEWSETG